MSQAQSFVIVGCGHMGSALAKAWLETEGLCESLLIVNSSREKVQTFLSDPRVSFVDQVSHLPGSWKKKPLILVLAVKPQVMPEVLRDLKALNLSLNLVVTIAAGLPLAFYTKGLPGVPVARLMPTLTLQWGRGVLAMYPTPTAPSEVLIALAAPLGHAWWVGSDAEIDLFTALYGCGPAYIYLMAEVMTQVARGKGVPPQIAGSMVQDVLMGAALGLEQSGSSPSQLRQAVTSQGGMTQAAMQVLMDHNALAKLMEKAIDASLERAHQLSKNHES
jgi:pyrroline-5-carboxylate reductase